MQDHQAQILIVAIESCPVKYATIDFFFWSKFSFLDLYTRNDYFVAVFSLRQILA